MAHQRLNLYTHHLNEKKSSNFLDDSKLMHLCTFPLSDSKLIHPLTHLSVWVDTPPLHKTYYIHA